MPMTAGTKTPDTLSAVFAIGAFVAAASLTIAMTFEMAVSSPTRMASHRSAPVVFIVAAETVSPSALSTGMLSPVRADSSTALCPLMTLPSAGMLSPGRTMNISPLFTCSAGITSSFPSRSTDAVFGASFIRLFSASVVLPFE